MNCIVCGSQYYDNVCAHCGFHEPAILGDFEKGKLAIIRQASLHREQYLHDVEIFIRAFSWTDKGGELGLDQEIDILLSSGADLLQEEQWIDQLFARIDNVDHLLLTVIIKKGSFLQTKEVRIPNLRQPEFQRIGLRYDGLLNVVLLLRNQSDQSLSEPIPL